MQVHDYQWNEYDRIRELSKKKANQEYERTTGENYGFDKVRAQCDLLALAKKDDQHDRKRFWECASAYLWAQEYILNRSMTLTYEQALEQLLWLPTQLDRSHDCEAVFNAIGWPEGWNYARKNQESWDQFIDTVNTQSIPQFREYARTNPQLIACERGRGDAYRTFAALLESR